MISSVPTGLLAGAGQVRGAQPTLESRVDGRLDRRRLAGPVEPVAKHHRDREEGRERVGDPAAGDVGRRAVHGLEQAWAGRRRGLPRAASRASL